MTKVTKMERIALKGFTCKALFLLSFFVISLGSHAQEENKTVTIQQEGITLREVFSQIEQQTGYTIAYELSTVDMNKRRSISLNKADINTTLKQVLQGLACTYKINGYHIIITFLPKEKETKQPKGNELTQTIRGVVVDSNTDSPIEFAAISVMDLPHLGTVSDSLGRFRIDNVPIGRHDLHASFIGYNERVVREQLLTSSKALSLKIALTENRYQLNEVVVTPHLDKDMTMNPTAITGGRMISMEEAGRFANGFDDPARMATAFAGVAGSIGTNALSIRGNTPQFTQWRLEGIEIPNPTHFADITGLGGGFLSALSTQVMGNSDFYNGAFPAEYNNGLSGVFDTYMRNGNNQNYEHTIQLGLLGIDLASEGPLSKKHRSSYIFNYRFSATSLATGGEADMKYQDVAFKLNFPTQRFGTFSIWGLGLFDKDVTKEKEGGKEEWETQSDRQSGGDNLRKMSGGVTHKYTFNETTYVRSSLAATYSKDAIYMNQRTTADRLIPVADIRNRKIDMVFSSYLNKKFNSRHTNRSGVSFTRLNYNLDYRVSPDFGLDIPMVRMSKGEGNSYVISAYSTSLFHLTPTLSSSVGITSQYFALNNNWTIEPRLSFKWQFKPQQAVALAYGLHSRRERLDYYFVEMEIEGEKATNKYLDFSKAHHVGISYDWNISPIHHLKIEPYFQYLFDIPVEEGGSFSIINTDGIYLDRILKNGGAGRNYGIDLTFEQYMNRGFYYMLTASLFKSRYKGGDHIWHNTRYDRGFTVNVVTGKEWMVGSKRQNTLGLNARVFVHGGERYSPIDEEKSHLAHDIVFDDSRPFANRFKPSINGDLSINFRMNRKKLSHEFAVRILNVGGYTGMHYYEYNEKKNTIDKIKGIGIIPNISYKIYF